jgi:molybdate transport system ATP-binding protein
MAEGLELSLRQEAPVPLNFDLCVERGQTAALVGPSGAGKTTVLRCIAGLHRPTSGHIHCNGQVWFDASARIDLSPRTRRVGLVFQSYALFPHMSALGNVMEAMLGLPVQDRREQAQAMLAQVGIAELAPRRPAQLSGGQQQRVALARALARDPDVLLLDEPFSAVDHPTRRMLHQSIEAVREHSDIPILLVTHDIADAARMADLLCLVQGGRISETGPPGLTLHEPSSKLAQWMAEAAS